MATTSRLTVDLIIRRASFYLDVNAFNETMGCQVGLFGTDLIKADFLKPYGVTYVLMAVATTRGVAYACVDDLEQSYESLPIFSNSYEAMVWGLDRIISITNNQQGNESI